jgi:hypothetical protein
LKEDRPCLSSSSVTNSKRVLWLVYRLDLYQSWWRTNSFSLETHKKGRTSIHWPFHQIGWISSLGSLLVLPLHSCLLLISSLSPLSYWILHSLFIILDLLIHCLCYSYLLCSHFHSYLLNLFTFHVQITCIVLFKHLLLNQLCSELYSSVSNPTFILLLLLLFPLLYHYLSFTLFY